MKNNIDAKVILLCRSDLFDFLPGANLNKIKQDSGIKLDWYQEGVPINSTNLVKLINLRTKIAIGRDSDFFSEFLPPSVYSDIPTIKTLLDNTRYRPRDLIQLLNVIQENTPKSKSMPDPQDVKAGLLQYSRDYLVGEIGNDLYGFLTVDEKNKSISLLSMMNKSIFSLQEIEEKKNNDPRFEKLDTIKILEALFDCGAILNFRKASGSKYSYTAKSRNPTARFDPNQGIRINWGLWRAFNIIGERYDPDW